MVMEGYVGHIGCSGSCIVMVIYRGYRLLMFMYSDEGLYSYIRCSGSCIVMKDYIGDIGC